jgi:hypothetical protein
MHRCKQAARAAKMRAKLREMACYGQLLTSLLNALITAVLINTGLTDYLYSGFTLSPDPRFFVSVHQLNFVQHSSTTIETHC